MGDKFFRWLNERRASAVMTVDYSGPDRREQKDGEGMKDLARWAVGIIFVAGGAWWQLRAVAPIVAEHDRRLSGHDTRIAVMDAKLDGIQKGVDRIIDRMERRPR